MISVLCMCPHNSVCDISSVYVWYCVLCMRCVYVCVGVHVVSVRMCCDMCVNVTSVYWYCDDVCDMCVLYVYMIHIGTQHWCICVLQCVVCVCARVGKSAHVHVLCQISYE